MNSLTLKIQKAFDLRAHWISVLESRQTDCYRLFCGEREGIVGLEIDRFGDFLAFEVLDGKCKLDEDSLRVIGQWYLDNLKDIKAVYLKRAAKDRSLRLADERVGGSKLLLGEMCPERVRVKENGLVFWVKPYEGYHVGLFLDQRENREFLSHLSRGTTVLNTFSYTGSFSVASAKAGARVTSVDLSRKAIAWSQANFELNDLSAEGHLFYVADVFDFLKRAARKKNQFDLVIVDPPSFSRNRKGSVFSVKKDLACLVRRALEVTRRDGRLFVSSNLSEWSSEKLWEKCRRAAAPLCEVEREALPPVAADFQRQTNPLSCCLLRVR